ncbi:MAG: hypothetical protein NVSMB24_02660 [Mucilaginibacter sp.]
MEKYDSRVDAYIARSADFAKPVLEYLREIVHEAAPMITETIKWGFPFFDYKGPVCQMASFKQHLAFGFWKASLLNDPAKVIKQGDASAGSLGRITSLADLPSKEILINLIQQAIAINEKGEKVVKKPAPVEKPKIEAPQYFIDYLSVDPNAIEIFNRFSPSQKKEYAEWIIEAKTDATRQKRMETALEWIAEGKTRHWKYK